jgi:carnitine-CoA ligase
VTDPPPTATPTFRFAELPSLQGRRFSAPTFVIVDAERRAFESVTWIDRVYTEPDPPEFPENIIEGFHSLAMLDAIQKTAYRIDPTECYGFNYGLNHVRFPSQMFSGDRVAATFEVRSVTRRGAGYLVVTGCELRVQGAEKPGLVAEWIGFVLPRQGYELSDSDSDSGA